MLSSQHYKLFSILSNESPEKIKQLLSKVETESKTDPSFTQTINSLNLHRKIEMYITDLLGCTQLQTVQLLNLIKESQSYISGSVLLSFEDRSFTPHDLDIFTCDPQLVDKISKFFFN